MSSSFRRSVRPTQNLFSSSSSNSSNTQQSRDSLLERPLNSAAVLERVGTKPWIGGLTLTSTGLRELDAIVGGGQPLGTVILVEEDRWTQDLALCLVRYWSAEVSENVEMFNSKEMHVCLF
jgi:GTP-sensing pleiotropic transcriptional regulator CodY